MTQHDLTPEQIEALIQSRLDPGSRGLREGDASAVELEVYVAELEASA